MDFVSFKLLNGNHTSPQDDVTLKGPETQHKGSRLYMTWGSSLPPERKSHPLFLHTRSVSVFVCHYRRCLRTCVPPPQVSSSLPRSGSSTVNSLGSLRIFERSVSHTNTCLLTFLDYTVPC